MKPVLPGETLTVNMWREGNRILFETLAGNKVVIGGKPVFAIIPISIYLICFKS